MPLSLVIPCAFGLESIVAFELRRLGYETLQVENGRVRLPGGLDAVCRANLWLRTADRVQIELGNFPALDFGELFDRTTELPWEAWIPADGAFPVNGRSHKSQLSSVPACQKIVKKAIVERLKRAHGVETLPETGPEVRVEVILLSDRASLLVDTTGPSLHKRGYRQQNAIAPLKETLGAALVMLSFWEPGRPFLDPFCGGGTIPIEAAMIGRNLAPGLNRSFLAEAWPAFPARLWDEARAEARDLARPPFDERLLGTDVDPRPLRLARDHAERAGVGDLVHFEPRAFEDLSSKRKYGCLFANPPYGERIGEPRETEALYRSLPLVLRRLPTWSHFILAAHPDFERLIGQPADRRRKLYNGRIECTYFQFHGPKPPREAEAIAADPIPVPASSRPDAEIAAEESEAAQAPTLVLSAISAPPREISRPPRSAVFGGLSQKAFQQAELFRSRLVKRARHLRRWPTKFGITCFRLYERDIPEIPLVVDRYEDDLHLAEFERPHERTPAEHADWLDLMVQAASESLEAPRERIFLKRRAPQRGLTQYEKFADERVTRIVREGGLRFQINLSDYLDVGLFLDHRQTRGMFREAAGGCRVLNLFGYTGAFSVYAAAGGATATTTVDLSPTYLEWAAENMNLNGFSSPVHRRVRSDALTYLANLPTGPQFDLAIVDPPTFSNSKRTEEDFDIQRDHARLLALLAERMSPGGTVFFSTHFRRFKLDEAIPGIAQAREITRQTIPDDFRNERIHRCWRLMVG